MTTAAELASFASNFPSFRNRFINGNQVIDQRNNGSAGTASANTLTYATDRWYIYSVGATCGYQRVAGPNTSDYAIQITPASSNTNSIVAQRIENLNCLDLSSQTVTISGKVYIDNVSGVTFNTNVYVASSANSSYGSLVSFSSALTSGQYVDFSGTVTLGPNAINGIEVDFSFLSAAGKTIKLTNLQLEIGTVATPFEHRPISVELSLAQRYFQVIRSLGSAGARNSTDVEGNIQYLQEMRSTPSISLSAPYIVYDLYGNAKTQSSINVSIGAVGYKTSTGAAIGLSNFTGLTQGRIQWSGNGGNILFIFRVIMTTYKVQNIMNGEVFSVLRSDGWSIPFDPANSDYQAYLEWLAEGNEPLPADEPEN